MYRSGSIFSENLDRVALAGITRRCNASWPTAVRPMLEARLSASNSHGVGSRTPRLTHTSQTKTQLHAYRTNDLWPSVKSRAIKVWEPRRLNTPGTGHLIYKLVAHINMHSHAYLGVTFTDKLKNLFPQLSCETVTAGQTDGC
jgi:hypothetical protein